MDRPIVGDLGGAVQLVYERALWAYKQEHARSVPVEDLYAAHVRTVEMDVSHYRNGAMHVNATVHSQRWVPSLSEFGRFRKVSPDEYIYERGTFDFHVS